MSVSLSNALQGQPWSLSAVMFDVNDIRDDEGRPVSERRAEMAVRAGVEMDMRECPFSGPRQGRWMNASALMQVSGHYNAVMQDFAALRRLLVAGDPAWEDILALVLGQLARPAVTLLRTRSAAGPVPAADAVAHKLAAGLFGVLRSVHERLALGAVVPVTSKAFLAVVDETHALVGPAEVCAGSPQMIRRVSESVVDGEPAAMATPLEQAQQPRVAAVRALALQVYLGIFWRLYDQVALWRLLHGPLRALLQPANGYLQRRLTLAAGDLCATEPPPPSAPRLPAALDEASRDWLRTALQGCASPDLLADDVAEVRALLAEGGAALAFTGDPAWLAREVAAYLHTLRSFEAVIARHEAPAREWLGYPGEVPVRLGHAALPLPMALHWYELMLGRRLGSDGRLSGTLVGRRPAG